MAQHGYMREWGEGDQGEENRERRWQARDRDDEQDRDWRSRDRGFMLGRNERDRFRDEEGGAWENNRDWPERNTRYSRYGGELESGRFERDYGGRTDERFGTAGGWSEGRRDFSSQPDDHYRSWRKKQIEALDRDYADYCREREQQFHQDFDNWRRNRSGRTQQNQQRKEEEELILTNEPRSEGGMTTDPANEPTGGVSPESGATLGHEAGNYPTARRR